MKKIPISCPRCKRRTDYIGKKKKAEYESRNHITLQGGKCRCGFCGFEWEPRGKQEETMKKGDKIW